MTGKRDKGFIYAHFCRADYDLHAGFSSEQKEALSTSHKCSRNYGRSGSLSSLIPPCWISPTTVAPAVDLPAL